MVELYYQFTNVLNFKSIFDVPLYLAKESSQFNALLFFHSESFIRMDRSFYFSWLLPLYARISSLFFYSVVFVTVVAFNRVFVIHASSRLVVLFDSRSVSIFAKRAKCDKFFRDNPCLIPSAVSSAFSTRLFVTRNFFCILHSARYWCTHLCQIAFGNGVRTRYEGVSAVKDFLWTAISRKCSHFQYFFFEI